MKITQYGREKVALRRARDNFYLTASDAMTYVKEAVDEVTLALGSSPRTLWKIGTGVVLGAGLLGLLATAGCDSYNAREERKIASQKVREQANYESQYQNYMDEPTEDADGNPSRPKRY